MTGAGVYYGAALTEAEGCKDQDVYIVGGANSAGQSAVYLSRFARSVTMLVRAPSLEASMSYYLIQQIAGIPNITVRACTEVAEAHGDDHLEQLTLRDLAKGSTEIVDASQLFIFIGAAPRTGWLDGVLARDRHGFVLAGPDIAQEEAGWPLDRPPYHLETSVARRVRGRRRPVRVGQAGRLGGGGGRDGRHVRAQVSGIGVTRESAMTVTAQCDPAELRTLFLFEKLTDAQLERLCVEGHVEVIEPRAGLRRG